MDSFDEQTVVVYCETGELAIRGEGLHISRIDVETGDLNLEAARIDGLSYADIFGQAAFVCRLLHYRKGNVKQISQQIQIRSHLS